MLALRPVQLADLPQLQQLARKSLVGITSLPDDRERLREKILASCASFEADVQKPGGESYFFVLQDLESGRLVGCSQVLACTGCNEPFYSLRNRPFSSESRELNIQHGVPALSLCQDLNGQTLLRGFHIDAERVRTPASALLSRARLMFIAAHPRRFADGVISEIVGFSSEDGQSPFWDAIGQHFFDLPYVEAERLCGLQSRTFLAELMPQYPIYVPMLPPAAQACIGRVHPDGQEAFDILVDEGFDTHSYVDIFDGGPTLHARVANIRSVTQGRVTVARPCAQIDARGRYLVSNEGLGNYRAIVAELDLDAEGPVGLTPDLLAALDVAPGEPIRVVAL
ncbi:arginine N-succinyltransferase [Pseudomonas citrulli]|uniref:Arginine N-succinyltransferase n=1 Tax=Pseudomonas citrulli TaxID=3064347 RepID=A0ABT9C734_9PSED|nr:arginine N-succinyltransferase [Pseudomonas sp. K18]MDO7899037.1 arginine N-succinyltransferase [Pseudomonas sp. K18]